MPLLHDVHQQHIPMDVDLDSEFGEYVRILPHPTPTFNSGQGSPFTPSTSTTSSFVFAPSRQYSTPSVSALASSQTSSPIPGRNGGRRGGILRVQTDGLHTQWPGGSGSLSLVSPASTRSFTGAFGKSWSGRANSGEFSRLNPWIWAIVKTLESIVDCEIGA